MLLFVLFLMTILLLKVQEFDVSFSLVLLVWQCFTLVYFIFVLFITSDLNMEPMFGYTWSDIFWFFGSLSLFILLSFLGLSGVLFLLSVNVSSYWVLFVVLLQVNLYFYFYLTTEELWG